MKYAFVFLIVFCSCKDGGKKATLEYYPMPEYYRKVTGYDSIEILSSYLGKPLISFTYPNEWEFENLKKDTVYIIDTFYVLNCTEKNNY